MTAEPEQQPPSGTVSELQERYKILTREVDRALRTFKNAREHETQALRQLKMAQARAFVQHTGSEAAKKHAAVLATEVEQVEYDTAKSLRMSAGEALHTWREELRTINGLAWAHKAEADLHRG